MGIAINNPSDIDVSDCASDSFYEMFRKISHQNSMAYDAVFKCIPSDSLLTFKSVQNNHRQTSLKKTNPHEVYLIIELNNKFNMCSLDVQSEIS